MMSSADTTWCGRATCTQSASALLAAGDTSTPLRAMIYLAITQREDGGFYQNFWIDGEPVLDRQCNWMKFRSQLLAVSGSGRRCAGQLRSAIPRSARACGYLIREGPATPRNAGKKTAATRLPRWQRISPALICAAEFIEARGDKHTAEFVRTYADFLESHVDQWTVTNQGSLVPGIKRHYIRIIPAVSAEGSNGDEDPDNGVMVLANQKPGDPCSISGKSDCRWRISRAGEDGITAGPTIRSSKTR